MLLSHIDATLNNVTLPIRSLNLTSSLRRFPLFFVPVRVVFLRKLVYVNNCYVNKLSTLESYKIDLVTLMFVIESYLVFSFEKNIQI